MLGAHRNILMAYHQRRNINNVAYQAWRWRGIINKAARGVGVYGEKQRSKATVVAAEGGIGNRRYMAYIMASAQR